MSAKAKTKNERRESTPGGFTIKLISGLLFAAFALYCVFNLYNTLDDTLQTTPAASVAVLESTVARGYIAREEQLVAGDYGLVVPELQNGVRAASGQAIAVGYSAGADTRSVAEARDLRARILSLTAVAATTPAARSAQSTNTAEKLAASVLRGDFMAQRDYAIELESLVMSAQNADDVRAEISVLQTELDSLTRSSLSGKAVYAPVSGIFAADYDGWEGIAPSDMLGNVPSGLDALFSYSSAQSGSARLVTGTRWGLALVLPDEYAQRLLDTTYVNVRLTTPYSAEFEMRIEEIGRSENGERVVTLSCSSGISTVLDARTVTAEVMFGEISGIRVPKAAVHLEPNANGDLLTYVYIAESQMARRVRVEILREFGDSFLVKGEVSGTTAGSSSNLREGVEIITKANGLYDGKVIR